jgi:hypothetical protein
VLPSWFAGDPPPSEALILSAGEERRGQGGIYDDNGQPIGKSWTRSRRSSVGNLVQVLTTTVLEPIALPGGIRTPRVRIETEITYRHDTPSVDELDFKMFGLGVPISLHAEATPLGDFPFKWQVGAERGEVVLDSTVPTALGDVVRPFDRLPNLYVGRSWNLKLLDPIAHLLPNVGGGELALEPVLIQVTGRQAIMHGGEAVGVYVVEGGGATAWVADDGRVLRQEVNLPLLGRLELLDEPYDAEACDAAARVVPVDGQRRASSAPREPLP